MILITLLSALLLLSPAVVSTMPETVPSGIQVRKVKKTETVTFKVSMHCKNCVAKITDNISRSKNLKNKLTKMSIWLQKTIISYS